MRLRTSAFVLRLSLIAHRAHAFCSSAPQSVHLKLDAPIRHLFEPQKKQVTLKFPSPKGAPPLQSLRAAIRAHCNEHVEPQLDIRHGKRSIESDDDLASVLTATAERVRIRIGAGPATAEAQQRRSHRESQSV